MALCALIGAAPNALGGDEADYRFCRSVHGQTTCLIFDRSCDQGTWIELEGKRLRCRWHAKDQCLTARGSLDEAAAHLGRAPADNPFELSAAGSRCNRYSLITPKATHQACTPSPDAAEETRARELSLLWQEIRPSCGADPRAGGGP